MRAALIFSSSARTSLNGNKVTDATTNERGKERKKIVHHSVINKQQAAVERTNYNVQVTVTESLLAPLG